MKKIKVNWINIMKEHMLKSRRLPDYKFPYAIMISKFIDYFEVDMKDELNETIKDGSEIDCSNLLEIGFQKHNDVWVSKTSEASSSEPPELSNATTKSQANEMNALIAYVPPMEKENLCQALKE